MENEIIIFNNGKKREFVFNLNWRIDHLIIGLLSYVALVYMVATIYSEYFINNKITWIALSFSIIGSVYYLYHLIVRNDSLK